MKYQLKLVTMYMAHRASTFRLREDLPPRHPVVAACGGPAGLDQVALGLVGRRVLVRVVAEPEVEDDAPDAGEQRRTARSACRQDSPPSSTSSTQISGVSPPMNRADIQIVPWATPRWVAGNQLYRARVMFGNAPASPDPEQELGHDQHQEGDERRSSRTTAIAVGKISPMTGLKAHEERPPDDEAQDGLARAEPVAQVAGRDLEAGVGDLEGDQHPEEVATGSRPTAAMMSFLALPYVARSRYVIMASTQSRPRIEYRTRVGRVGSVMRGGRGWRGGPA